MKMDMKFYDTVSPILEEQLKDINQKYDSVMVSLISFMAATLIEKTISMVNDKAISVDHFHDYLDQQLRRTVGSVIESTDKLLDEYVTRMKTERDQDDDDSAFDNIHPTVQ